MYTCWTHARRAVVPLGGDHFTVFPVFLVVSLLLPDVDRNTAALRPSVAHTVRTYVCLSDHNRLSVATGRTSPTIVVVVERTD